MTPRQTSRPMKSASSSGPIGWFRPTFAPVSMSSAVPRPSSKARIASARNGIRIRLTMKPGRSAETMTCLPMSAAIARTAPSVASLVADPRIELDERHHRDRAEEVHADEPRPPLLADRRRQPVDRDRRGVRREDRAGRREPVELAPRAAS